MAVKIIWNSYEWAEALRGLPTEGPLPNRTVLVPRAGIAHVLRRELIRNAQQHALAGTRFVSPRIAAMEVLRGAGFEFQPGEEALRETRLAALFRSDLVLRHFPIDLLLSTPGWDDAFARTISDLEEAGLRPAAVMTDGSKQLQDILTIWRALDESAGHCWTVGRIYLEAALLLEQKPEAWLFAGPTLLFALSDLTAGEARFLRAIPDATLGLVVARPVRKRYIERMEKLLGGDVADALRVAEAPRRSESERDLLASYLFETPMVLANPERPRSNGPDGTVDLEEHAGIDAELAATADWVTRQIANGIPLEDIAILVPTLDPLVGLIADRLAGLPWHDGDFPFHIANGLPFTHYVSGARVLAVLRALRGHLAADLLSELLPALRLEGETERHLTRGAAMDLLWSLGTVGGNPAHPEGAFEWSLRAQERQAELENQIQEKEAAANQGDEDLDFSVRHSKRRVADLRALRPALNALVTISRSATETELLCSLWPMLQEFFDQWLLQPSGVSHVVLNDRLDILASDTTCGSLAGDDALKVIEDVIVSARIPVGRFGDPVVYVGTVKGAAGLRFTAVRVIGLSEGHLPSLPREDPVMPDASRQTLKTLDGNYALLPLTADRALEDLHGLDLVIRNTDRVIALSTPRLDAERSEREPSSVILEAAAALSRPNRVTGERGSVIPERIALTRDAFIPAREDANRFRNGLPLTESGWQDGVAQSAVGLPARWGKVAALDLQRIEQLTSDIVAGAMDGMIGDLAAKLPMPGLPPDYPISASGIAQLLSCPHAFLLSRLLYFQEPSAPPPQREIGQPYYGLLFHEVAARFYAVNGAAFCAHKDGLSNWLDIADRLVESAFQEFIKQYPLVGDGVRAQQRRKLKNDVRALVAGDWNLLKDARVVTEKSFGYPLPIELRAGTQVLYLHGRIDRIEIAGQNAVIRDLKTARARPRLGRETNPDPGLDVQIAVYGLIAELLAKDWQLPKQIAVGYAYFGRPSGERLFGKDYQTLLKPAASKWLEIAAGLLTERQFPRTPNADDCRYCLFQPVCGDGAYNRANLLLDKASGAVANFAALKLTPVEDS
jgi:hypothetical protein